MFKRVVHIDQDFPRRFSEQATKTGPNHANWGFNTTAASLNGNITTEPTHANGKLTQDDVNNESLVDASYDKMQLTQLQLDNLAAHSNDGKQIRFNANVFNYIVHTEINNIILKYDAPVVYTEGKENKETGEFTWKEHYLVLKGYDYHILFDILMHDPMGIDAACYEAYVRNKKFGQVLRKNSTPSDVSPNELVSYATFTDEQTVVEHSGDCPIAGKWITLHSSTEHFKIEKMLDPYDETDSSFRISVQLSGQGYDTNYINTSDTKYQAWKTAIDDPNSSEELITQRWEECEGVKFKFFDVAGNITYWVMPYIEIDVVTLEELYNMKKLVLEFIDTRPADLFLGTDLIGRTTIKVTNPNIKLVDQPILINLDKESIGEIYPSTQQYQYVLSETYHKIATISTEDVGNIAESGWVIAHAEVDIEDFIDELEFARIMVRNLLRADGALGEWIKECLDNTRKITLDPFVSQYLKESTDKNNAYYKFVKFTERYLNTMFKAYDKDCYISVLEAIARIGNFNDYTTIYKNLLDKYDNDHGDMLHIDADDITLLIDADRQELD